MQGMTIRRSAATLALVAAFVCGPTGLAAWADQPSDPNGCGSSCTGGGGIDVLSETFTNTTLPQGPLPKTGSDSSLSLMSGIGIGGCALALRKVARRT